MIRQRGIAGILVAVFLLLVIAGMVAGFLGLQRSRQGERFSAQAPQFEVIKAALVQFVAANSRLPCPANPALDTGLADPEIASATCTSPAGTVPWASLGIRREDAIDSWGWKISYRVYTGSGGSLTQERGASMLLCDKTDVYPQGLTPISGSTGKVCRSQKDSVVVESDYLSGKGLSINWFGTAVTDAAYVLISHGPSGLGAYTATAGAVAKQNNTVLPSSAAELSNLSATGPFVATTASSSAVGPAEASHFDDYLAYENLSNLLRQAGHGAREWPEGTSDETLNLSTVTAALGRAPAVGEDLATTSMYFAGARITGLASSGATTQNLTFDDTNTSDASSGEGLGTASGGTAITSGGEGIRIELKVPAKKFGVTLNHFGTVLALWRERAEFRFYNGAALISTQIKLSCNSPDGGLASFEFDLGGDFDKVDIFPLVTTSFFGVLPSSFFLGAFKSCETGTCQTSLYNAGNACP